MKLIELTVKNINSLRNIQKIEFDNPPLSGENLFLITGPTGSGKTTILDAVTAALFDRTPRLSSKNTRMLKNQSEKSAAIELVFELGGHIYRHLWQIDKKDLKKISVYKDEELVAGVRVNNIEKHTSDLLGLEFESFTKTVILAQNKFDDFLRARPEERRKIIETVTGNEILEKIKIAIKDDYERRKNDYSIKKMKMDGLAANIGVRGIETVKKDLACKHAALEKARAELRTAVETKTSMERLKSAFDELEAEKKKYSFLTGSFDFNNAQTELLTLKKARDHFSEIFHRLSDNEAGLKEAEKKAAMELQEVSKIDSSLGEYESELASLKERKKRFDGNYNAQKASLIRAAAIKERIEPLESSIGLKNEKAGDAQLRITQISAESEAASERLALIEKNIAGSSLAISALSTFAGTEDGLNNFKTSVEKFNLRTADLARAKKESLQLTKRIAETELELSSTAGIIEASEKKILEAGAEIKKLESEKEAVSLKLDAIALTGAAFEMRLKLKDGCACPVCGSFEHPALKNDANIDAAAENPAELKKAHRDLELQLKELEKRSAGAESEKRAALGSYTIIKRNLDEKNDELLKKSKEKNKLSEERDSLVSSLRPPSPIEGLAPSEAVRKWDEALKALKTANSNRENLEKEKALIVSRAEKLTLLKENDTAVKNELLKEIAAIGSELDLLNAEFGALTLNKDPDELLNGLEAEKNLLESETGKLEKTVSELNSRKISRQAFIIKLHEDISGFRGVISNCQKILFEKCRETGLEMNQVKALLQNVKNLERLEQIYALKSMEKNRIESRIKETESILNREPFDALKLDNAKTVESSKSVEIDSINREIGELSNQIAEIEKLDGELKKLSAEFELIKNDFTASEQLYLITKDNQFRDFVLSFHMTSLLALASQYLKKLTGGRYEFASDSENANQIFIKDYLNEGLAREISTISGGESFMASLSLALALSQISAGKTSIDFMFLDEGFGVLDSDALEDVLDMINNLNNIGKKIGIISHIREVKERIPARIEIIKQADGSSILKI